MPRILGTCGSSTLNTVPGQISNQWLEIWPDEKLAHYDSLQGRFRAGNLSQSHGWTKPVLQHQSNGKSDERSMLNQTNFESQIRQPVSDTTSSLCAASSLRCSRAEAGHDPSTMVVEVELAAFLVPAIPGEIE